MNVFMRTCMTVLIFVMVPGTGLMDAHAASQPADQDTKTLKGERRVTGTVEEVKSGQIKVNTGEMQPRFIPLSPAKEKGLGQIKEGDTIEITLNDQNLIVDYHVVDAAGHPKAGHDHQIVKGQIAKPLAVGHEQAVIRTNEGQEKSYEIRSQARSKMASIPVGIDAEFLLDETDKIVDVTFKDEAAAKQAGDVPHKKSPPKGTR